MPQREIDSPSSGGAQLVASLLARIDGLTVQIAARDNRIDELLAQVKALNARIAEFEAKRGGPPKTPDNSSLPPSRGQKANAELPAVKQRRKGRHAEGMMSTTSWNRHRGGAARFRPNYSTLRKTSSASPPCDTGNSIPGTRRQIQRLSMAQFKLDVESSDSIAPRRTQA